ncbi:MULTISPECIES: hypothetical protein [unclassified Streptomyces]|uniref:hypothetical protein n=1 Tax=unclassified Streptomyces TaxID=2593676 RepID=UPI0033CF98A6
MGAPDGAPEGAPDGAPLGIPDGAPLGAPEGAWQPCCPEVPLPLPVDDEESSEPQAVNRSGDSASRAMAGT